MSKRPTHLETPGNEALAEPTPFDEFVDHEKKALQELGKAFAAVIPEGVREHGESAVKEVVEGYRGLFNATLDDVIQRIERAKFDLPEADRKTRTPVQ